MANKTILIIKNIILVIILIAAVMQWYGIGERTYHAWWVWYKWGEHTTVSMEMAVVTYVLSFLLIGCGLLIRSYWELSLTSRRINTIALSMLIVGISWLSLLLTSPFAVIVNR